MEGGSEEGERYYCSDSLNVGTTKCTKILVIYIRRVTPRRDGLGKELGRSTSFYQSWIVSHEKSLKKVVQQLKVQVHPKLPNYPSRSNLPPATISSFSKSVSLFLFCKFICIMSF